MDMEYLEKLMQEAFDKERAEQKSLINKNLEVKNNANKKRTNKEAR